MIFRHRTGALSLNRAAVMGILNVTPDSFYDGGRYLSPNDALDRARQMEREGARILDIGGCSTRPGSVAVPPDEEWRRLRPVLGALRGVISLPVSVDTTSPEVAEKAVAMGADILNDVSGSLTSGMIELAASTGTGMVITYPGNPGGEIGEDAVLEDAFAFFDKALARAESTGLPRERVILDIGIGFGKTRVADLTLIAKLAFLIDRLPPVPVLCGASRKRVVAAFSGDCPPGKRLAGTVALHTAAVLAGAKIVRAHDVAEAVQAAAIADALSETRTRPPGV